MNHFSPRNKIIYLRWNYNSSSTIQWNHRTKLLHGGNKGRQGSWQHCDWIFTWPTLSSIKFHDFLDWQSDFKVNRKLFTCATVSRTLNRNKITSHYFSKNNRQYNRILLRPAFCIQPHTAVNSYGFEMLLKSIYCKPISKSGKLLNQGHCYLCRIHTRTRWWHCGGFCQGAPFQTPYGDHLFNHIHCHLNRTSSQTKVRIFKVNLSKVHERQ